MLDLRPILIAGLRVSRKAQLKNTHLVHNLIGVGDIVGIRMVGGYSDVFLLHPTKGNRQGVVVIEIAPFSEG